MHIQKELDMKIRFWLISVVAGITAGIVYAQFPWEKKGAPKSEEEQRVIGLLRNDPQMRAAFINQVAGPIANKMFECGMIP
jgi:hypothetical protein